MSASKLGRSASDSWSVMPHTAQDGLTDTATAAAPSPCETHDAPLSAVPPHTHCSHEDDTAEVMCEHADNEEAASEASADSWVELTAVELQSRSGATTPAAETEVAAVHLAEEAEEASQTCAADVTPCDPVFVETSAAPEAGEWGEADTELPQTPESVTLLRPVESAAEAVHVPAAAAAAEAKEEAVQPALPTMALSEFLATLTLTRAYDATAAADRALTEHEAAAQVLATFDATEELTDDFTALTAEEREAEETIDLDCVPSSVPLQRHTPIPATAPRVVAVPAPEPVGVTALLRRRMVAEDWERTLRGPSPLTPEERVAVFQAMFGEPASAPISAERFKEMMVPFDRHCDCLGASYGFHHQGCRYSNAGQITS